MEGQLVFISYARADGEDAALQLESRLKQEGIEVWMDRQAMRGGRDWWEQITDAIDRSAYLVLIVTPASLESPTMTREWKYAREKGVCVCPVKASPDLDFTLMPKWMRSRHFYTFPTEWDAFLSYVRSPCQADRVPSMAPELTSSYVARSKEFDTAKEQLLGADRDGRGSVVALLGSGGFGKTTLATALCHDEDVLEVFDSGVLWVTLGREPGRILREFSKLYRALTGERLNAVDEEDAARELRDRLSAKRLLLVIDDVWEVSDIRWFLDGGPDCGRVVTTRQFEVARAASATPEDRLVVGEMSTNEAVDMLVSGLDVESTELAPFYELAGRLGEWPLLIGLARGALDSRLTRDAGIDRALQYVNTALDKKGLTIFDRKDSGQRNDAAAASVEVSLSLLDPEDVAAWQDLAVFPEDTPIPLQTLAQLWGEDDFDTEDRASRLDDLSLVRLELGTGTIRVHDVLLAVAQQQRANEIEAVHGRLLAAWGEPSQLPDDRYAWAWIGHHLVGAGRADDLASMLSDPDWLEMKLAHTDVSALLLDFSRVGESRSISEISEAVEASAHVLALEPGQLRSQLRARLAIGGSDVSAQLLQAIDRPGAHRWLRPRFASLAPRTDEVAADRPHAGEVVSVALSPDGSHLVTASYDHSAKVWTPEGELLQTLAGHQGRVMSVCSSVGRAFTGSADRGIRAWDPTSGEELWRASEHTDAVLGTAVSADGMRLVSASADQSLKLWDANTGALVRTFAVHDDRVNGVAFVDDSLVVTASADRTAKIVDLSDGSVLQELTAHGGGVFGVAVSPDGEFVATAASDRIVRVWEWRSGRVVSQMEGHASDVYAVRFTPDGSQVFSSSGDHQIKSWDVATGAEVKSLVGHTNWVYDIEISDDGRRLFSGCFDSSLKIWDLDSGDVHATIRGDTNWVFRATVSPDGDVVIGGSERGHVNVWAPESGDLTRKIPIHEVRVNGVAFTRDGQEIVTASADQTIRVTDFDSGALIREFVGHAALVYPVVLLESDGLLVSGSFDHTAKVWDFRTGECRVTFSGHTGRVNDVAVIEDRGWVLSASWDNTIKVWSLHDGGELRTLEGHADSVFGLATVPGTDLFVSGSADGTVRVWDAAEGTEVHVMQGHRSWISGVAVSDDGRYAVSASGDNSARVWDIENGVQVGVFSDDRSLNACGVLADGGFFAAGGSGRLHVFDLVGSVT